MAKIKLQQSGFSAIEGVLIAVIVIIIGVVGWYVFSAQKKTNTVLNTGTTTPSSQSAATATQTASKSTTTSNSPGASDNTTLESDLNGITSSSAQSNQDLNSATTAVNDKSTFTSVPQ